MNNPLRRIWIVFKKEVIDNLRDRRSMSSSLLIPIFMPVFLIALIMVVGKSIIKESIETPLDLPVVGADFAPELMAYLKQNNVHVIPFTADPQAAVLEGQVNLVLIIHKEYGQNLAKGQAAPIDLVMDNSRQSAISDIQRTRNLINSFSSRIASLRLEARGVSPSILNVISIQTLDLATPQSQAVIFLNMMPFLLIMTVFLGGMNVIIDTTAGERERGSLEPLLINPARRSEFVLGKLMAALPFSVFSVGLSLVLFWVGFNLIPLEEYVGFKMTIDQNVVVILFWLCLPMVLLASALQLVVASFTRSYKEAQTYLSFLPLIAGLPGAFLAFLPVKASFTTMLIPTFGQSILINQFLRGETVLPENMLVTTAATLAASFVVIVAAIGLYQREQILAGR